MMIHKIIGIDNIKEIESIISDFDIPDNNERADMIKAQLENYADELKLTEIGCGTNRIVFISEFDPHYVYKIGLDDRGIKDNNLEEKLTSQIDAKYITPCVENIGIVSRQERVYVMKRKDMDYYKDTVTSILGNLSENFILNDVGYDQFLNWGLRNGNEPVLLDYAYLRPITQGMNFVCTYNECGGRLRYTKNFKMFKCIECGYKHSISEIQDPIHVEIDSGMVISDSYMNK